MRLEVSHLQLFTITQANPAETKLDQARYQISRQENTEIDIEVSLGVRRAPKAKVSSIARIKALVRTFIPRQSEFFCSELINQAATRQFSLDYEMIAFTTWVLSNRTDFTRIVVPSLETCMRPAVCHSGARIQAGDNHHHDTPLYYPSLP